MKKPLRADDDFVVDLLAAQRRAGVVDIWWLGQSGFLLQHRGRWILVDPYLSDSLTEKYAATDKPHVRITQRVISPERLIIGLRTPVSIICSHAHTDHLDGETLKPLIRTGYVNQCIFPKSAAAIAMERATVKTRAKDFRPPWFETSDDGSRNQIGPGIMVHGIASAHETVERDEEGHAKYLGYVFEFRPSMTEGNTAWTLDREFAIYHAGDTVLYDGLAERLKRFNIDVAILPINGRAPERRVAGNLNGREAANLAKEVGAKLVIPCHYDMFEFNTADPADEFIPECERIGQKYRVLRQGERWSSDDLT